MLKKVLLNFQNGTTQDYYENIREKNEFSKILNSKWSNKRLKVFFNEEQE